MGFIAMIGLNPHPQNENRGGAGFFSIIEEILGAKVLPFSCGRSAILAALRAVRFSRMDEILVPPFLCQAVLSSLNRSAFPTMTSSSRTKSIFVYHQFGYPQQLREIQKVASENGWMILNDCANTIFSEYRGVKVIDWGDFSVLSFSKLYPCTLGGALVSPRGEILEEIDANYQILSRKHAYRSNLAHRILENAKRGLLGTETEIEVDSVYGYISEIVAFPSNALKGLPNTYEKIRNDIEHRKNILRIVTSYFPDRVPDCCECDVVPFGVPIAGPSEKLELISRKIKEEIGVDVPTLHFDFQRNMLNPDYKKSLVIGCHQAWSEEIVNRLCQLIKDKM